MLLNAAQSSPDYAIQAAKSSKWQESGLVAACRQRVLLSTVEASKAVAEAWFKSVEHDGRDDANDVEGCWFLVSSLNVSLKTPVLHQDQISQRAAIAANATQSCKRQDSGIDSEIQGAVVCFPHAFISYPSVRLN